MRYLENNPYGITLFLHVFCFYLCEFLYFSPCEFFWFPFFSRLVFYYCLSYTIWIEFQLSQFIFKMLEILHIIFSKIYIFVFNDLFSVDTLSPFCHPSILLQN